MVGNEDDKVGRYNGKGRRRIAIRRCTLFPTTTTTTTTATAMMITKHTLSRSRRGPPRARAILHHLDGPRRVVCASRTATDTPLESSASPMADGRRRRYLYASGPDRCSGNMLAMLNRTPTDVPRTDGRVCTLSLGVYHNRIAPHRTAPHRTALHACTHARTHPCHPSRDSAKHIKWRSRVGVKNFGANGRRGDSVID